MHRCSARLNLNEHWAWGAEGSKGIEGIRAGGTGAVVGGAGGTAAGAEEAGARGSSVGSATGGRSVSGISAAGWSLRRTMKGTGHGLPQIDSKGGLVAATTLQSGARPRSRCAPASGTGVTEIGEAWTQLRADFGDRPCP